ncbi:MAG: T9SS type A sorting domain-containing protein [Bacteroidota bacterium]
MDDHGKVCDSTSARITDLSLTEEEAISAQSISIYPNPSNESFEVSFGELEDVTWELTDVAGRRLNVSSTNRPGKVEIGATTLGSGVYLLTVTSSLGKITERIVILK